MNIIDGKEVAAKLRKEIAAEVETCISVMMMGSSY